MPIVRALLKNQMRSCRMGPLNAMLVSQLRISAGGSTNPKLRSSSSMLLPCAAGLRNHVERRAAAIDFREAAGDRHLHLGRVRHVVLVAGHAAAADR